MANKELGFWDSEAEKKVFYALSTLINKQDYIIFPHQLCLKVFKMKMGEMKETFCGQLAVKRNPTLADNVQLDLLHYDFVIYDKIAWKPVLIIEINGSEHKKSNRQILDNFKSELALSEQIPLLVIDFSVYVPDEKIAAYVEKNLRLKIEDELKNKSLPAYCEKCSSRLEYQYKRENQELFFYCTKCRKNGKPKTYSRKKILVEDTLKPVIRVSFQS